MEFDGMLCNYESIMFYLSKIEGRTAYDRFYRRRESDDQCQVDVTQLRGGKTTLMFGGASSNWWPLSTIGTAPHDYGIL